MSESGTTAAADAAAGGTTTSAGAAGAAPGSTPSQGAADAAVGGNETAEDLKARLAKAEERAAFLEKESKEAYAARDKAKQKFLETDEGKNLTKARDELAALRKAQDEAVEAAAKEQGKWKELYETEKGKRETAEKTASETVRTHREARIRGELARAYSAAGGVDETTFLELAAKNIAAGEVAIADDGVTVSGAAEVVKKFQEGKPYMFKPGGGSTIPGGPGGGPPVDVNKVRTGKRGSLAEGPVLPDSERKAWLDQYKNR